MLGYEPKRNILPMVPLLNSRIIYIEFQLVEIKTLWLCHGVQNKVQLLVFEPINILIPIKFARILPLKALNLVPCILNFTCREFFALKYIMLEFHWSGVRNPVTIVGVV